MDSSICEHLESSLEELGEKAEEAGTKSRTQNDNDERPCEGGSMDLSFLYTRSSTGSCGGLCVPQPGRGPVTGFETV